MRQSNLYPTLGLHSDSPSVKMFPEEDGCSLEVALAKNVRSV